MLEIYKRRYELTAQTEEQVAALVAPSADRAWGDHDDPDDGATADAVASPRPQPAGPVDPAPSDDHPDGKEPA